MGTVVGPLLPDVAAELGLPAGIPVAAGGADAFVAMIGLNVVAPGKMAFITGSSHLLLGQSAKPFHGKGIFGTYTDAVVRGQYTVEGGQVSTGSIVKWLRDNFCANEAALAAARGVDTYTVLNEMAAAVPPGSEGLDRRRLLPGQPHPLRRPRSPRHHLWPLAASRRRPPLPRRDRRHRLRHRAHPPGPAQPRLQRGGSRRLRRPHQEQALDADPRRRLQHPDHAHGRARRPHPRLRHPGRRRRRLLSGRPHGRRQHGPGHRPHHAQCRPTTRPISSTSTSTSRPTPASKTSSTPPSATRPRPRS